MAAPAATAEPIRDLIETLRGKRSWRQLEQDCGGNPSRKYLSQWITQPPEDFPSMAQIQGLSKGLNIKPAVIVQTWGIALGIWTSSDWGASQYYLLDGWTDLTTSQQAAVAGVVREMRTPKA